MPPHLRPPDPLLLATPAVDNNSNNSLNRNIIDSRDISRGRSRTVSRIALARRASEERKAARRAAALHTPPSPASPFGDEPQLQSLTAVAHAVAISSLKSTTARVSSPSPSDSASPSHQPLPNSVSSPIPSSSSSPSFASATSPTQMHIVADAPVAGPSTLPNMANAASSKHVASATARPHSPHGSKSSTPLFPEDTDAEDVLGCTNDDEEDPDNAPLPPRSLRDQMQEAYAAEDMHTARILFLRIKGIEVTGDDDPRIAEVRDEDFEFGTLVLDEEILVALEEARERRRQEEIVRQRRLLERERARKAAIEAEAARREAARLQAKMYREKTREAARIDPPQPCNIPGRVPMQEGSQLRTGMLLCRPAQQTHSTWSLPSWPTQTSSSFHYANDRPASAYYKKQVYISSAEINRCRRGRLFIDSETSELGEEPKKRSPSQERLLGILLQEPDCSADRRRMIMRSKARSSIINWDVVHASAMASNELSSSVKSSSTISRTNSWTSASSSATSSTCITSPPNSPSLRKACLPAASRKPSSVSKGKRNTCLRIQKGFTPIAFEDSPLFDPDDYRWRKRRGGKGVESDTTATKLLTRVKQSVSGILDLASKMQQSYLRTIQFSVALPIVMEPLPREEESSSAPTSKPLGYRATSSDVQVFAPQHRGPPTRELNFTSEYNIPLTSPNSSSTHKSTHSPINGGIERRVPAQLMLTPPSPQRFREAESPEWRIRPVSNPCTLRLRALANRLGRCGVEWEGRAPDGSLACGRERVMGVAFEGLGGSRLAFEAH